MAGRSTHQQLVRQIIELVTGNNGGAKIAGVSLIYADRYIAKTPVMYQTAITILLQGQKTGYLGNSVIHYGTDRYLLLTIPLPFECETFATPEAPLVGITLRIDPLTLQDLLVDMGDGFNPALQTHGIHSAPLTEAMLCTTGRLLSAMQDAQASRVLGPQLIREMLYHVLQGECGGALLALASRQTQLSQIVRALRRIECNFSDSLSVELLASEANMSVSAFHRCFKAVTSTSPLQYLKSYRLHQARMMLQEGMRASTVAVNVGYESASQFSREFKRYFGMTPGEEMARVRLPL